MQRLSDVVTPHIHNAFAGQINVGVAAFRLLIGLRLFPQVLAAGWCRRQRSAGGSHLGSFPFRSSSFVILKLLPFPSANRIEVFCLPQIRPALLQRLAGEKREENRLHWPDFVFNPYYYFFFRFVVLFTKLREFTHQTLG